MEKKTKIEIIVSIVTSKRIKKDAISVLAAIQVEILLSLQQLRTMPITKETLVCIYRGYFLLIKKALKKKSSGLALKTYLQESLSKSYFFSAVIKLRTDTVECDSALLIVIS